MYVMLYHVSLYQLMAVAGDSNSFSKTEILIFHKVHNNVDSGLFLSDYCFLLFNKVTWHHWHRYSRFYDVMIV